MQITPMIQNPK